MAFGVWRLTLFSKVKMAAALLFEAIRIGQADTEYD
jgi:hypothetical protein